MLRVHAKNLGSVAIVCLQGRMVRGETAALRNAVHSQSEVSAVVLDLARVSTIDAGGLGVMLELREQTQSKGIASAEVLSASSFGQPTSLGQLASCA